ncbi:VOC family protein [Micromonospora chokoriensis]
MSGTREAHGPDHPHRGDNGQRINSAVTDIDEAVDRIGMVGGRWTGERHDYQEGAVLVMTDPEGNEFCVVQHYRV